MVDVGLLVLGWELPYLRPCWLKPGGPWDGEEPPWIGLAGGWGPGGPANLAFWDQDQWLGGGCLWGWLASLSTLRQTYTGINILMPLFTNDYARRISLWQCLEWTCSSGNCRSATCSYVLEIVWWRWATATLVWFVFTHAVLLGKLLLLLTWNII